MKGRSLAPLWATIAFATASDAMAAVVIVFRMTAAGPGWVDALISVVFVPPLLCVAAAGRLIDRRGANRVLVVGYLGAAVVAVLMAIFVSPPATLALAAARGVINAALTPALLTFLPTGGTGRRTVSAYALLSTCLALGQLTGPLIGGALHTSHTGLILLIQTAACIFLAGSVRRLGRCPAPERGPAPAPQAQERSTSSGLRIIVKDPSLRACVGAAALVAAAMAGCLAAAPFRLLGAAHAPAFGTYQECLAVGSLSGAQLARYWRRLTARGVIGVAFGSALTAGGLLTIALTGQYLAVVIGALCAGMGVTLTVVPTDSLIRSKVPSMDQGHVFAVNAAVVAFASAVAIAISSVAALDPRVSYGAFSAVAVVAVVAVASRGKAARG